MTEISLSEYSKMVGIPEEELKGRSKKYPIAIAREVYWFYLNTIGHSFTLIAKNNGRVRVTISSGVKTIKNLVETNHPLIRPHKEFIESFSRQTEID